MSRIKHRLPCVMRYRCPRTGKVKTLFEGYPSDGATGTFDIRSVSWWIHDGLCPSDEPFPPLAVGHWERDGYWDDGTACTPKQSSDVLKDILVYEGRWFIAKAWTAVVFPYQRWAQRDRDMSPISPLSQFQLAGILDRAVCVGDTGVKNTEVRRL